MNKPIKGFEHYTVDENGVIVNTATGVTKTPTSNHSGKGYWYVDLYNNGLRKRQFIHRLVADAFIANPDNKPFVNHIDGNPANNHISNLEWCTAKENVSHAGKIIKTMHQYELANLKRERAVKQMDYRSGRLLAVYRSIQGASRATGIPSSNIVAHLKGRQTRTRQFCWCYVEELEEPCKTKN